MIANPVDAIPTKITKIFTIRVLFESFNDLKNFNCVKKSFHITAAMLFSTVDADESDPASIDDTNKPVNPFNRRIRSAT